VGFSDVAHLVVLLLLVVLGDWQLLCQIGEFGAGSMRD
jgi:hypothetical protein